MKPVVDFTLTGDKELLAALRAKMKEYPEAAGVALYSAAVRIINESTKRTPRKDGWLRGSNYISAPHLAGPQTVVELGYGTEYAARQHEETSWKHLDGESKYLAKAVSAQMGGMLAQLGADLQKAIDTKQTFGASGGIPTRPRGGPGKSKGVNKNGAARFKSQLKNVRKRTGR